MCKQASQRVILSKEGVVLYPLPLPVVLLEEENHSTTTTNDDYDYEFLEDWRRHKRRVRLLTAGVYLMYGLCFVSLPFLFMPILKLFPTLIIHSVARHVYESCVPAIVALWSLSGLCSALYSSFPMLCQHSYFTIRSAESLFLFRFLTSSALRMVHFFLMVCVCSFYLSMWIGFLVFSSELGFSWEWSRLSFWDYCIFCVNTVYSVYAVWFFVRATLHRCHINVHVDSE